ncbi:hypothetical protein [Cupriavidus sp. IDO]|uniref:hypothetical protein n=1 Tax=Cupriavidus sp. IDO TaxID=1539142 RepID=UPI0007C811C9|nr:hypothetical protein [Cupriavidus sp. IDO]
MDTSGTGLAGHARRATGSVAACAAALAIAACATGAAGGGKFDVDSFLRASDTALPEVLGNTGFLAATRLPATDCAVMLQSTSTGVLENLPPSGSARGPAWLMHPTASPGQVWLVVSEAGGERTCHGPLPADAMKTLVDRAKG